MKKTNNKNKLKDIVLKNIIQYNKLLLAFSGGIDSTVLLDILNKLKNEHKKNKNIPKFNIRAIHINHGINKNSNNWVSHCIKECKKRKILIKTFKIPKKSYYIKDNIEKIMRQERYKILSKNLLNNEVLITAQHKDDQVETMLLALKRGSGPNGLKSMLINTKFFKKHKLIRPILYCEKKDIIKYAKKQKLVWIEDNSNYNTKFDRNFLRLKVLPILKKRWPWFLNSASRSAKLCHKQEILLNELLKDFIKKLIQPDGSLQFTKLITTNDITRIAILKKWMKMHEQIPSNKQLIFLWKYVIMSKQDAIPKFQLGKKILCRFQDKLYLLSKNKINQHINNTTIFWNKKNKKIILPKNLGNIFCFPINDYFINIINKYNKFKKHYDTLRINNIQTKYIFNNLIYKKYNKQKKLLNKIEKKNIIINITRKPKKYEKVYIKFTKIKEQIYINNQKHGKSLKKILKELSIPPWERNTIPLLFYNEKLISAIGIFITNEGKLKDNKDKEHMYCLIN
ncbi:MAG: tRNA(Ile)-lysidine synthase [Candidatus Westeberhardia cardiocondylae]|nr:tRNA(Ile)-lysidine synthase [Candidatus Westeberhardia cardiocondylae]